jgi:hypothetical protein
MVGFKTASPLALDPTTRRLILLLPAAFLAHDLGELVGNDLNRAAHDVTRRVPVLAQRALPYDHLVKPFGFAELGAVTSRYECQV